MKNIASTIEPRIVEILQASGVPVLAVGVIQNGVPLRGGYFGYRDIERKIKPDGETFFYIASLSKAMTTTSLGILVDRGLLEWNTPIHETLPEIFQNTWLASDKINVINLLSHRSGVAWGDALYLQFSNTILLPRSESIKSFESLNPPRSTYSYNNHAYNIAGLVAERCSQQTWGDFLRENVFCPLGMSRTFTYQPDDPNVALFYTILSDKTPFKIPFSETSGTR